MKVKRSIRERAQVMYEELQAYKLEVVLIPAPIQKHHCHCIRVATMRPPQWFSAMARRYPALKRELTLKALQEIAQGEVRNSYGVRWLREIERQLANELAEVPF